MHYVFAEIVEDEASVSKIYSFEIVCPKTLNFLSNLINNTCWFCLLLAQFAVIQRN